MESLSDEIRVYIRSFYNWNWVLIPALKLEIAEEFQISTEPPLLYPLIYCLEFWLQRLQNDSADLRCLHEGKDIAKGLEEIGSIQLSDLLNEIIEYNLSLMLGL